LFFSVKILNILSYTSRNLNESLSSKTTVPYVQEAQLLQSNRATRYASKFVLFHELFLVTRTV